jgi:hypothetical protein
MSHPSVQEYLRDAKYTSLASAQAAVDKAFKLRSKLLTDKGTYRIPFKDSALTHYGAVPHATTESVDRSSGGAPSGHGPGYDVISGTYYPPASRNPYSSATSQHTAGAPPPLGQGSAPDYYAKGKRQLDGAGRGHLAKFQRTDQDQNRASGTRTFRSYGNMPYTPITICMSTKTYLKRASNFLRKN